MRRGFFRGRFYGRRLFAFLVLFGFFILFALFVLGGRFVFVRLFRFERRGDRALFVQIPAGKFVTFAFGQRQFYHVALLGFYLIHFFAAVHFKADRLFAQQQQDEQQHYQQDKQQDEQRDEHPKQRVVLHGRAGDQIIAGGVYREHQRAAAVSDGDGRVCAVVIYFIYIIISLVRHALAQVHGESVNAAGAEHRAFRFRYLHGEHAVSFVARACRHGTVRARSRRIPGDADGGVYQAAFVIGDRAAYAAQFRLALVRSGGVKHGHFREISVIYARHRARERLHALYLRRRHFFVSCAVNAAVTHIERRDVRLAVAVYVVGNAVAVEVVTIMDEQIALVALINAHYGARTAHLFGCIGAVFPGDRRAGESGIVKLATRLRGKRFGSICSFRDFDKYIIFCIELVCVLHRGFFNDKAHVD